MSETKVWRARRGRQEDPKSKPSPYQTLASVTVQTNPEVTKVSDVARYAGEAWRAITPEVKDQYETKSTENKVGATEMLWVALLWPKCM